MPRCLTNIECQSIILELAFSSELSDPDSEFISARVDSEEFSDEEKLRLTHIAERYDVEY